MNFLRRLCDGVEKAALFLSSAALVAFAAVGTAEIFSRGIGGSSIQWAQEFNSLALGISVFFAAPVIFRRNRDAFLGWFRRKILAPSMELPLELFFDVLIIIFLAAVLFYSLRLQVLQAKASSPSLGIGMNWFSLPVSFFAAFTLLFYLEHLVNIILSRRRRGREN